MNKHNERAELAAFLKTLVAARKREGSMPPRVPIATLEKIASMLEAQPDDGCVLRPEDEIQVLTAERDFWKQVASSQRRDAKSEQGWPFTGCSGPLTDCDMQ